ncbi:MAG: radical SAM family heme chaperone HemW [Cyanobacteria bacterium P01_D01_bin.36]
MTRSAYVHIPFCRRRCFYCDFAISVVGDRKRGDTSPTMARYIDTLIREIQATPIAGDSPQPLATVFFGGGTPSLLAPEQVEQVLSALNQRFGIAPSAEISMEMDPATFELAHAQGYRSAGINRVSLGAQAFQDEVLAAAGRFHRREDIVKAVETLRIAGFENISLDLISGLPHQTMAHWRESLREAIALSPTHLSIYDLVVEPQTAFARYFTPGEAPLPSDRTTADMYNIAQQTLVPLGYEHYEICNFAQPGYAAQHNLTYWRCESNYGFGMGATSYLNHQRIDRPRTQKAYRVWVDDLIHNDGKTDDPRLPETEQVMETIMMGLRLAPGISLRSLERIYGASGLRALERAIAPHIQNNWVIVDPPTSLSANSQIRLSDPTGFLMSNVVITDAFNALESVAIAH